jgi:hypothetical protein
VRGQKNEFHALEKCYNYFSQSTIEEIDIAAAAFCQYFSSPSPKWGFQSPKFSDSDFREVRGLGLGLGRPKSSAYWYVKSTYWYEKSTYWYEKST